MTMCESSDHEAHICVVWKPGPHDHIKIDKIPVLQLSAQQHTNQQPAGLRLQDTKWMSELWYVCK